VSSNDDIVTLTTPNGSDTITVSAEADWLTDITTMADSDIVVGMPGSGCDTFTIPDFDDGLKWDDVFLNNTVKIGNTEITEAIAEKMIALIDMIEGLDDNNALKELFNTQLGMNKIRGNNDET
jgi:hypothetical protein